jgi:uncharacterized lipoprotein NlpE involved in copper resistance
MHKYISTLFSILFLTLIACDNSQSNKSDGAVWSKEKTWNWYNSQPWLVAQILLQVLLLTNLNSGKVKHLI